MPVDAGVDSALVERFKRDWFATAGAFYDDTALVALSGGPDSTALLLLMRAIVPFIAPPIAATVDHGLRPESAVEAGAAADLCRSLGVPHATLRGPLPARVGSTTNLSARARALRYELLEEHASEMGARWIVTAHHADDQLETLIMRLNRGSGVRGLAGIRPRQDRIVRPLLQWKHDELAVIVTAAGVVSTNDPSNVDDRYDRARLRKLLAQTPWLDARAASRSAQALTDAEEAIEWYVDDLEPRAIKVGDGEVFLNALFLPIEARRRLVERCLRHIDTAITPRGRDLSNLVASIGAYRTATLGGVAIDFVATAADHSPGKLCRFRPAPPRRPT